MGKNKHASIAPKTENRSGKKNSQFPKRGVDILFVEMVSQISLIMHKSVYDVSQFLMSAFDHNIYYYIFSALTISFADLSAKGPKIRKMPLHQSVYHL